LIQVEGEEDALGVVIATNIFNGQGIAPEPLNWVSLHVVLGDPERFEFLRKKQVTKSCRIGGEAIVVACFSSHFTADMWRCDNPPRKIPYYHLNKSTLVIKQ
jgi:hypothetical protein